MNGWNACRRSPTEIHTFGSEVMLWRGVAKKSSALSAEFSISFRPFSTHLCCCHLPTGSLKEV